MFCMPSYNVLFYLFIYLFIFIVRRPWPNFVCKGRHTSSVVLAWVLVLQPLQVGLGIDVWKLARERE